MSKLRKFLQFSSQGLDSKQQANITWTTDWNTVKRHRPVIKNKQVNIFASKAKHDAMQVSYYYWLVQQQPCRLSFSL